MYNRIKVTYPIHFKDFKCIGGKCEDTCCKGWDIEIDKDTFDYYFNSEDEEIQRLVKKSIFRNPDCTSDDLDYGVIRLNSNKICPFLDGNRYCIIHGKFGEEHLSSVCTHFPRIMNKIDNKYEISLDIACPEASRLMLLEKEPIQFDSSEIDFFKYIINDEYNTNSKKYKNSPIKYLKEIRRTSIKIMQVRDYNISKRFFVLGHFIEGIEKISEEDYSRLPVFIDRFNINEVSQMYKRNNMDYIFQIIFFKNIIDYSKICEKAVDETFKKYARESLDGFNISEVNELKDNVQSYISAYERYDKELIETYSYIFENYIVNFMYNSIFPFSDSDFMVEGFIMLLVRYSFIRFFLVGRYIDMSNDTSEEIIKFITSFARTIEHDRDYLPNVLKYIKENNYENMSFAKKLL